ncbi:fasciclin domain-containing protein [Micromonospora sp. HM5-17]|uniref:fasciclin domain-containing protein n=1 Tax=Micromonospora sp. HM5-17 TaxID=2487710 RepID=UPI0011CD3ABC|nr:fasciclin domain-containing protein [Micromonospora sp. HM5-17]
MFAPSPASADPAAPPGRRTRPAPTPPHPRRVRRPGRLGLLAATLVLAGVAAGCTGDGSADPHEPGRTGGPAAAATGGVSGPLCAALPAGTDPGNPDSLVDEPADQAMRWIPVLTTFEAAVRAAGLSAQLRDPRGVTVLAPTDDAFARKFSASNLDELMIHDRDTLRTLLRAHLVAGSHSLADLLAAGTVTTMDGTRLTVTPTESMARLGDTATTICADYRVAGGRIHLIDAVLGTLPTTAGLDDDPAH